MKYDLVFEGGGAKGMVFVGALQEFEARGHTFQRLLGTSAGAITAALLAAGYDSQEMLAALAEQKDGRSVFTTFMAEPSPFAREVVLKSATLAFLHHVNVPFIPDFIEDRLENIVIEYMASEPRLRSAYSLLEYGGWFSADNFVSWMHERLDTGMCRGKPRCFSEKTLSQFFDETQVDLTLVASDTTAQSMLVLNHHTAPDLPIVWAVRMSMSIPLLWQAVVWLEPWGKYRDRDMTGHVIVDGGLLSNFPIELFVSDDLAVTTLMGHKETGNVLGLLIDETLSVPGAAVQAVAAPTFTIGEFPAIQRISGLVNTTLTARDKMVIDAFENLVARMPALGYGTTEFDMTEQRRELLVSAGRAAMKSYLDAQTITPATPGLETSELPGGLDLGIGQDIESSKRKADKIALRILSK